MNDSTTIDTLSIEITSNSAGAASGIDALATSLGKLKQNGSVGVAVRNLNNLTSALKQMTSVNSNATKLTSLANAVTKLSGAGSFSKVITQLNKLPSAVKGLDSMDFNGLDTKFEKIASAANRLSGIKAGGLSAMVNSLGKLSQVTASLDDATIAAFVQKVDTLNTKLGPLSQKMATVSSGFKTINSTAKKAATGTKEFGSKVNATTLNLSSMITVVKAAYTALLPIINLLTSAISDAIEWEGIAQRFGRGFGESADEVYAWVKRLNEEMGINTQQFMQYSSVYATMLTGFGVAQKDASEMALGYMELTYDIWAGYNDIYKSLDDAAIAVRSAIAGEVEPVRKAGFTIIESTLEQTAANYGLKISLENATEAQKSYLRYLTLVDQAYAQNLVGTYAKEMNTAEGLMRTFRQQLKSLAQTFGSLFLPILVKIMPYVQAFVELIADAIRGLAAFFGVEIQEVSWGDASSGLGGITDSAGDASDALGGTSDAVDDVTSSLKDLKHATVGIDELNVISPPKNSNGLGSDGAGGIGGSGGSSAFDGMDIESLWDESIFDNINSQVDAIKAKFKEWLPILEAIGIFIGGWSLVNLLSHIGQAITQMNVLQKLFATVATVAIEAVLVFKFADNYLESGNLLYLIGEALVTAAAGYLMFKAWGPGGLILALSVSIIAQLVAINANLADGGVSFKDPELWIQGLSTSLMGAFGSAFIASKFGFTKSGGFIVGLGITASLVLASIRNGGIKSGAFSSGSFEAWATEIGSVLAGAIGGAYLGKMFGNGALGLMLGVTVSLILNLVGTIESKGEDFGNEISDWINVAITTAMTGFTVAKIWGLVGPTVTSVLEAIGGKVTTIFASGGSAAIAAWGAAIVAGLGAAVYGIYDACTDKLDWLNASLIAGGTTLAGAGVGAVIGSLGGPIGTGMGALIGLIVGLLVDLVLVVVQYWDEICAWFGKIGRAIGNFFTETIPGIWKKFTAWLGSAWESVRSWFADLPEKARQWGYDIGHALGNAVKWAIDFVTNKIPTYCTNLWNKVSNELSKFFTETLPDFFSGVWDAVAKFFGTTIPNFFTKTIPTWWNDTVRPMFTKFFTQTLPKFFTETIPNAFKPIIDFVKSVPEKLWDAIQAGWNWFVDIGKSIVDGIWKGLCSFWDTIKNFCSGIVDGFCDALGIHSPSTVFAKLGTYLVQGLGNGVRSAWDGLTGSVKSWVSNLGTKVRETFDTNAVKDKLQSSWNTAKSWWDGSKAKLSTYTPSIGNIKDKVSSAWNTAKTWWSKKGSLSTYTPSIGSIKSKLSSAWSTAKSWWSRSKGSLSYTPTVGSIKSKLQSAWSTAKSWWSKNAKLSIPSLSLKVTYSSASGWKKAIVKALDLPGWPSLKFAKNGGIFDAGSLIWAGESGAEIVANAGGGKTGVMNVNQMQDAVYEGVYSAVVAAMRATGGNSGEQAVNVYLDGKQITSVVEKRQHERGASIMGNQVYSY